jgi:protein-L-isoaspartate(D-aspartate) O-methyltransferase
MNRPSIEGIGMTSQRTRDRLVARLREDGITDERVLEAIRATPRHLFVDEAMAHRAYEDTALPIGHGQTISQPHIVALMTAALIKDGVPERVLEIGTGCGYQTAVLARLVDRVLSIERIRLLQERARERLKELGLRNVRYRVADGAKGWPDAGPFDAIMVTAAPAAVPEALVDQLAPGGRLVIPVGEDANQELLLLQRTDTGVRRKLLRFVRFVPLLSGVTDA